MANTKKLKTYTVWIRKQDNKETFQDIKFYDDDRAITWVEKHPYAHRLTNDKDVIIWKLTK